MALWTGLTLVSPTHGQVSQEEHESHHSGGEALPVRFPPLLKEDTVAAVTAA